MSRDERAELAAVWTVGMVALVVGFALGVIAGLSLIYNQPPPRPLTWTEPYPDPDFV